MGIQPDFANPAKTTGNFPTVLVGRLAETTGKSRPELQFRMQFAERYPTEEEVCMAPQTLASWTQVKKSLPKPSDAKARAKPATTPCSVKG